MVMKYINDLGNLFGCLGVHRSLAPFGLSTRVGFRFQKTRAQLNGNG